MADPQTPLPLLTLDTLIDRKHVVIDGQPYVLRPIDDLPLFDYKRMMRLGEEVKAILDAKDDATPEQERQFERLMDDLLTFVFEDPLPAEVRARLGTRKRLAIWGAFQMLSPSNPLSAGALAAGAAADGPSATSSSSPDSPVSTPEPAPVTG